MPVASSALIYQSYIFKAYLTSSLGQVHQPNMDKVELAGEGPVFSCYLTHFTNLITLGKLEQFERPISLQYGCIRWIKRSSQQDLGSQEDRDDVSDSTTETLGEAGENKRSRGT
jgi:hypothetical protein